MLKVTGINKTYANQVVLRDISFSLNRGERLGIVGPNGSGKTTLLRILAGEEQADSGEVPTAAGCIRIGYLPQGLTFEPSITISGFLASQTGDLQALEQRLSDLASMLGHEIVAKDVVNEYDRALAYLQGVAESLERSQEVLGMLGLGHLSPDTHVAHLSGGQKTRLALAGVLLAAPELLLLDEPTNHLDLDMLEWLESWLVASPICRKAATLIVSHDRLFLDKTTTAILELDGETHTLKAYLGNYSAYLEQKLAERQRYWQAYQDQQEEIMRLRAAAAHYRNIAQFRKGGKADTGDKFAKGFFANRSRGTVGRARRIEKRLERLLTQEHIEKPRQAWQMKLEFNNSPDSGRQVLVFQDLSVGYGEMTLLSGLNCTLRYGERLALIGPNGSGKTTLLRTIAGEIPPLHGNVRFGANVQVGYMTQEQEELNLQLNALETIRKLAPFSETGARAFLHKFLFSGDDVFIPVGQLSYGERARLSLAGLAARGCNLLLLDEPVNHLDIPSRERFEQALRGFQGTIMAVVHDRYFIAGFASQVWEVRLGKIEQMLLS